MPKERIMITGSEGLIGKVLVDSWKDIFDIVELDIKAQDDGKKKFAADISNKESLELVFYEASPLDAVVHLAGKPEHTTPWEEVLKSNIIGTRNVFECMAEFDVKRAVVASTTHLQGGYDGYPNFSPFDRPIRITDCLPSDSHYGCSKAFAEAEAGLYFRERQIRTICLRIGSVTRDDQPHPDYKRVWLSHRDASQVFLKAIDALNGETTVGIYYAMSDNDGNPFDLKSTTNKLGYHPQDRTFL